MKIAITGHTRGIGKAIYDSLSPDYEVLGFSRSNGYDISDPEQLNSLIAEIQSCDVFINNAYVHKAQTKLLKTFCEKWESTPDKFIIHMGSKLFLYDSPESSQEDLTQLGRIIRIYSKEKQQQEIILNQYLDKPSPKVCNLQLGPVDTDMIQDWEIVKIPPEAVASIVKNIIEIKDYVFTQKIVIDSNRD